jgi:hypothetical protein
MPPHATVAEQADVYAALLDHLRLERVVLCGFSAVDLQRSSSRFAIRTVCMD